VRFGGFGSGPTQMDYESECEEGSNSDGNGGSQGGLKVYSF